ncbi:tartrate transporter [Fusarium sp. NRRL 52700]|nr:tartrate transporter [Fusarium sp. NRRL 52700]
MADLNEKATFDHASLKGAESTVEQTPEESEATKKLLRKCDLRLIPPLMVIFFLSFMDRTNIGNAKIQGMTEDLKMTGNDYNMALFVFFIPYIIFEVPSNIMIKRISPSLWLAGITVLRGISTVGMGLVNNVQGLIACRVLLGFFEAGIVPGCIYLISMYYRRYEVQWRMSLFFSAAILAGAFSGLLAFAIAKMHDVGGLEAWRWIFILEGILTVVIGVIAKWWIPDWPETANFLNDDERSRLIARLADDSGDAKMDHLNRAAWKRILSDWKIYLGTLAYFGIVNNGYAGSFFIPTILREMGYAAERAQVLTIPVYIVATIGCLSAAYLADRMRHRYGFTMFGVVMTSIGYILLLLQHQVPTAARYFALFLLVTGGYITQPVVLGWLSNTMGGHYKRSIASAAQVGFGNLGGIVASNVYLTREAPEYWTGLGIHHTTGRAASFMMDSHDQGRQNLSILNRLPLELLNNVIYTLPNVDIKNLRLTCSYLGSISLPRFNRIFLSTSLRDIEVFTSIVNHDVFRLKVTEIIYDDSRFDYCYYSRGRQSREVNENTDDITRVPHGFERAYSIITNIIDTKEDEFQSVPHVKEAFKTRSTMSQSYQVYRKLKLQQDEVLTSGRDADALRYGLLRFPNLKRVTISPAAHGILGRPLYLTPTIRSFPEGLIYPLERGWSESKPFEEHPLTPWDESSKREWRGFCVVTKEIARHIREDPIFGLSEFIVEGQQLWTGISCRLFENPAGNEYHDFVTILSHPPLRRLDLSIACGTESRHNWPSFRSGLLFEALRKGIGLYDLRFDTSIPFLSRRWHTFTEGEQNGMPVRSMFPVHEWSNLRRLCLSRSFIKQRDLMAFIPTLPKSLESLELSFLSFFPDEGTYRDLLQDMRCNLGWRERPSANQPKLIVLVIENELSIDQIAMDVSCAAMEYLYRHGENPFVEDQILEVLEGKGTPVDLFDPLNHGRFTSV